MHYTTETLPNGNESTTYNYPAETCGDRAECHGEGPCPLHPDHTPILLVAYNLLGDGQGDEWDHNPEYTRAVAEMVRDLTGLFGEADNDEVLAAIRKEGER